MGNLNYFQQALARFTHEFANGDIIRKYSNLAYSISEIRDHLDFKSSREQIHKIMWEHFMNTKQIIYEEPGTAPNVKYEYVKDISAYGKVSFRKVKITIDASDQPVYTKMQCTAEFIKEYLANPATSVYVSIPFGIIRYKDQMLYEKILNCLDKKEAIFLSEIFIERKNLYYKLNKRMAHILLCLMDNDLYHGSIYISQ